MKISVIIPNFHDLRIDRALRSIRNQTYKNIELIIVHGGPLSEKIKSIYINHKVDILINEPDKGIFDALNKGVEYSTGDLIYLLGSDDYLSDNEVFSNSVNLILDIPEIDGVCLGCVFVNSDGNVIRKWFPKKVTSSRIKFGLFPPHFSLLLKKNIYCLVGKFKYDSTKNIATDILWLLDLAILKPDLRIDIIKEHYLLMEYGGASTKSLNVVLKQFKVVHSYARMNKKSLPFWFLFSFIRTGSKIFQFKLTKA
jgi:glycosyltransferase involved in cell wall biosynthesis